MIKEAQGKYLILNGQVEEVEENESFELIKEEPQYEVFVVVDSVVMFFEEHMARLEKTADKLGLVLTRSREDIEKDLYKLIKLNDLDKSLIKLIVYKDKYLVYEHYDRPVDQEDLDQGVKVAIFDYERQDPNLKILRHEFKREVAKFMIDTDSFEALLRTKDGELLEGSRTNLYFTQGDKVISAPADRVLRGITRSRMEKIFKKLNIDLEEKVIRDIDLVKVDGAFLSGTTVGILPIKSIESIEFDVENNKLIKKLVQGYKDLQAAYIKEKKESFS
ncbi:MAG: aminotransferase class IV [Bacillota bacterium]|nr:aminotransferase class IV [Bacillota bacterium]